MYVQRIHAKLQEMSVITYNSNKIQIHQCIGFGFKLEFSIRSPREKLARSLREMIRSRPTNTDTHAATDYQQNSL